MRKLKIQKKVTNIVPRKLTLLELSSPFEDVKQIIGFIYMANPEVFILNIQGKFANDEEFWIQNGVTVFTHETLHRIMYQNGITPDGLDHPKWFRKLYRNHFFVDADWKWIENYWTWENKKWVIKKTFYSNSKTFAVSRKLSG